MKLFPFFYNGRIGVVDLTLQSSYTVDFEEEALRKHLLGASLSAWLLTDYESDSLVFGTGPLTGSFAPASSLLVATFRSPRHDHLCHVPFMLRTGPEMKFAGLDFLVIRGASEKPCAIHVGRGSIALIPLQGTPDLPVPEMVQSLMRSAPGFRASIVTGPAANRGSPFASASVGIHGSLDRVGLAARMTAKNLKAVLFNGIGGLPHREDHPALYRTTEKLLRDSGAMKTGGFVPLLKRLDDGDESVPDLRGKLGRNRACYHCPCPCMSYAAFRRPEGAGEKDGLLLMDPGGWISLSRKSEYALPLLKRCLELGLDPRAAGYGLRADRPLREAVHTIEALAAAGASIDEEDYPSAPGIETRLYQLFGGGIPPLSSGKTWTERVASAMILGICPIFIQTAGRLDRSDLLRFLSPDTEEIKTIAARLDGQIWMLLTGILPEHGPA
jgi:hypothetical protein